VTRLR